MRTEQLSYLIEVAFSGSINASADKLHISQQSLNISLKNLENELGTKLFVKSKQGSVLTPQGETVLKAAYDIVARLSKMKEDLNALSAAPSVSGNVLLQSTPALLEFIIPGCLSVFYGKYPGINLSVTVQDMPEMIENIKTGKSDIAIFGICYSIMPQIASQLDIPENIKFVPLFQHKYCVAASPNHPIAKLKNISIKKLLKYPLAICAVSPDTHNNVDLFLLNLYGTPQIKLITPSAQIYKNTILSGQAIGFYPAKKFCGINIKNDEGFVLIPLKDADIIYTIGYCYNTDSPLSAAMQCLIDELITFCN